MATAVLTNPPTVIDNAEAITNWGGDTFATDADIKVQGNSSVACTQTNNGINDVYVTGTWDFSTDVHLRLWINSAIIAPYGATEANNGVQIFLYDGTNTAYYTVSGSDTYAGGWQQMVVYTGNTPTSGTVTKASITRIGIRINTTAKPRNITNGWYDAWTYGDGYTVTGGTSGDEIDWSDIAALDKVQAYGIVTELNSIYFLTGKIRIGDGVLTTYFKTTSICVFKDLPVYVYLYELFFVDLAAGETNIEILGGSYSIAGTTLNFDMRFYLLLNSCLVDGVQIIGAAQLFLAGTIKNCVFDDIWFATLTLSGVDRGTIDSCTFRNVAYNQGAYSFPVDSSIATNLQFINCQIGVNYTTSSDDTDPTFDNFTFDDVSGKYDIKNNTGSTISISLINGSNANSYDPTGSTVTFVSSVSLTVTCRNQAGLAVPEVKVRIEETDGTLVSEGTTNSSGIHSATYGGSTPLSVKVIARLKGYKFNEASSIIEAGSGMSIPFTMIRDPAVNLP